VTWLDTLAASGVTVDISTQAEGWQVVIRDPDAQWCAVVCATARRLEDAIEAAHRGWMNYQARIREAA